MSKLVTASEVVKKPMERMESSLSSEMRDGLEVLEDGGEIVRPPLLVLDAMRRRGFPHKFLRNDWETPEFVKKYAPPMTRAEFRDFKGLFLTGPTGRKKTATLCLMVRDWLKEIGHKGSRAWKFVSFPELCIQLQESWNGPGGGPLELINQLASEPLLIIDDVGVEKTTDFVLQSAYLLFNKREQNEFPTYGTSNMTVSEIGEKLDDRIASRIRGMCNVVAVGGEDMRGKG